MADHVQPRVGLISPSATDPAVKEERVTINTANISAVKHSLDDAVKDFFDRSYRRSHRHENIKLVLGWTAALLAAAVSLYGLKVPFKDHKSLLTAVVLLYYILSGLNALYVKYIECDSVFEGRKKIHNARIETHTVILRSKLERKPYNDPRYDVSYYYVHSTNNGKSLLKSRSASKSIPINILFNKHGVLIHDALNRSLTALDSTSHE